MCETRSLAWVLDTEMRPLSAEALTAQAHVSDSTPAPHTEVAGRHGRENIGARCHALARSVHADTGLPRTTCASLLGLTCAKGALLHEPGGAATPKAVKMAGEAVCLEVGPGACAGLGSAEPSPCCTSRFDASVPPNVAANRKRCCSRYLPSIAGISAVRIAHERRWALLDPRTTSNVLGRCRSSSSHSSGTLII